LNRKKVSEDEINGSHVAERAGHGGHGLWRPGLRQHPGKTEVGDLGPEHRVQQDVARLDVAVNDGWHAYVVHVTQPLCGVDDHLEPGRPIQRRAACGPRPSHYWVPAGGESVAVEPLVQAPVVHVVVHEELGLGVGEAAQQPDDVNVPDVAEDAGLRLELALQLPVQFPGGSYLLHGHRACGPVEPVGEGDAVHAAGPAAADDVGLRQALEYGLLPETKIHDERRHLPVAPRRDEAPFPNVAGHEEGDGHDDEEERSADDEEARAEHMRDASGIASVLRPRIQGWRGDDGPLRGPRIQGWRRKP
jgi:hypothetical protein